MRALLPALLILRASRLQHRVVIHRGFDEAVEERMRVVRLAEELRMELAGDEIGM